MSRPPYRCSACGEERADYGEIVDHIQGEHAGAFWSIWPDRETGRMAVWWA